MHRQFSHFRCRNWVEDQDGSMSVPFLIVFLTATSLFQAGNKTFKRGVAEVRRAGEPFRQLGPFGLADTKDERLQL